MTVVIIGSVVMLLLAFSPAVIGPLWERRAKRGRHDPSN